MLIKFTHIFQWKWNTYIRGNTDWLWSYMWDTRTVSNYDRCIKRIMFHQIILISFNNGKWHIIKEMLWSKLLSSSENQNRQIIWYDLSYPNQIIWFVCQLSKYPSAKRNFSRTKASETLNNVVKRKTSESETNVIKYTCKDFFFHWFQCTRTDIMARPRTTKLNKCM